MQIYVITFHENCQHSLYLFTYLTLQLLHCIYIYIYIRVCIWTDRLVETELPEATTRLKDSYAMINQPSAALPPRAGAAPGGAIESESTQ